MLETDASRRDRLFAAVACQLAVAMLLGGTARPLHVFVALLASLPTLYLLLAGTRRSVPQGRILAAALALFGLAWLQLVPLPPAIWTALPGRDLALQALAVAGLDPGWRPIALDPGAAFASLLACTAPLVMLAAFARLTDSERAALLQAVVAFALLSAMLGIAQRLTGTLTPYAIDHAGYATGLFANRNHLAALLACAIVLAPAALTWGDGTARRLLAGGAIAVLAAGIAATTSRAGIALGVAAILALPLAYRSGWRMAAGAGLALLVLLVVIAQLPALAPVAERFAALGDDQRLIMAETTWKAAQAFFPWGSGWGSFVEIYMASQSEKYGKQQERLPHSLRIGDAPGIDCAGRKKAEHQDYHIADQQPKVAAQPSPLQRGDRCEAPFHDRRADIGGCVHSRPFCSSTMDSVPNFCPVAETIGDFP